MNYRKQDHVPYGWIINSHHIRRFRVKSSHRSTLLSKGVPVLFALLLTPAISQAQDAGGKFNLPFEVHWGNAVLSPGDYTFTIISSKRFYFLNVRSKTASTLILPLIIDKGTVSEPSQLKVARIGQEHFIESFAFKELGITFRFSLPSSKGGVLVSSSAQPSRLSVSNRSKPISNQSVRKKRS